MTNPKQQPGEEPESGRHVEAAHPPVDGCGGGCVDANQEFFLRRLRPLEGLDLQDVGRSVVGGAGMDYHRRN